MSLDLYNTLTRRKEAFVPADPRRVTVYVCGPTVYSYAHIGNARPAVAFDVLVRLLRHLWPDADVVYARNITDLDDKINAAAREQGVAIGEITAKYGLQYRDDMAALGVAPPDIEPHATEHIPEMIAMAKKLIDDGFAYEAEGHVLFHVPRFPEYGELSRRDRAGMIAGARVEVAPYKRDPADFVLWKPSTPDLPGWDSPWGRGRPGWHLECSCMIEKHLGRTIDIHAGGGDLVFPHHENEIAQSRCAHGTERLARFWLHNGFVNVDREKMAKSVGNVVTVHEMLDSVPGEAIRMALLNTHYRQPLDWSDDGLAHARDMLDRLYGALRALSDVEADDDPRPDGEFLAALGDDINTPRAIAALFRLGRQANTATDPAERRRIKGTLLASGALLGILQQDCERWFVGADETDAARMGAMVEERARARAERRFGDADRIRDELAARGIMLEDGPEGTRWRRIQ